MYLCHHYYSPSDGQLHDLQLPLPNKTKVNILNVVLLKIFDKHLPTYPTHIPLDQNGFTLSTFSQSITSYTLTNSWILPFIQIHHHFAYLIHFHFFIICKVYLLITNGDLFVWLSVSVFLSFYFLSSLPWYFLWLLFDNGDVGFLLYVVNIFP